MKPESGLDIATIFPPPLMHLPSTSCSQKYQLWRSIFCRTTIRTSILNQCFCKLPLYAKPRSQPSRWLRSSTVQFGTCCARPRALWFVKAKAAMKFGIAQLQDEISPFRSVSRAATQRMRFCVRPVCRRPFSRNRPTYRHPGRVLALFSSSNGPSFFTA
jgi:hypothetical protein